MSESSDDYILIRVADDRTDANAQPLRPPPGAGVEQQAFWNRSNPSAEIEVKVENLKAGIERITEQLEKLFQARTEKDDAAFELTSFTVGLTVSASGKVAIVAEVGAEASIQVTFERCGRKNT